VSSTGWSIKPAAANSQVTVSESNLTDVLGGTRFTSALWTSTTGDSTALYTGSYAGSTGFIFLNTGAGNQYGWIDVLYNAGGAGLNADFSGEDKIQVIFDPDHLAFGKDSIMRMKLVDSDSSYTAEKKWVNPADYVSQPGVLVVDFLLSSFAGIDLGNVKSVEFLYEGDYSNDVAFNSVSVVPIPGAVWLLASGLVGLVGLRRRFQK
jgi:hypothetical protein